MRYAICIMFNDVHLKRFVSYVGSSLCNYALLRSKVQLKAAHTTNKQKTNKQTYTHNKQTNTQTTSNYHIPKHIHILKHNTVLSSPIHFYSPVNRIQGTLSENFTGLFRSIVPVVPFWEPPFHKHTHVHTYTFCKLNRYICKLCPAQ